MRFIRIRRFRKCQEYLEEHNVVVNTVDTTKGREGENKSAFYWEEKFRAMRRKGIFMKKVLSVLLVVALFIGCLAGCSGSGDGSSQSTSDSSASTSSGDGERLKIGIVLKTLASEYWVDMAEGIEAKAEELGVDVEIMAAASESDTGGQPQMLEDMVSGDYDGIGVAPITDTNLINGVAAACEKGIPVVDLDQSFNEEELAAAGGWLVGLHHRLCGHGNRPESIWHNAWETAVKPLSSKVWQATFPVNPERRLYQRFDRGRTSRSLPPSLVTGTARKPWMPPPIS